MDEERTSLKLRVKEALGVNRHVGILAASTLAIALGEELWLAYLPKYLVALGASGIVVGIFGSTKDMLDGLYQYPGGWTADKYGRKRALMVFTSLAIGGYLLAAAAPSWILVFPALVLIMAWKSGAFPVTFAVIGDALPQGKRGIAFSVQSIMQRFPRVIGAPLGGALMVALGLVSGIKAALLITIVLALGALLLQFQRFPNDSENVRGGAHHSLGLAFARLPHVLKKLLLVECLVRMGEAIAASFIILYVTDVLKVSIESFGLLYALQQLIAILMYLPAGKIADLTGRRPIIALTFLFFATFPLAVFSAHSTVLLILAFVIGGLKEFGEPARKSFIVDQVPAGERGRAVGMYYTVRNLVIIPGGAIGGILWGVSVEAVFATSVVLGLAGVAAFLFSGGEFR